MGVEVLEVIEHDCETYIVMKLATRGELFDYAAKQALPEREARRLFQQIVAGVEHCHKRGVVHRDLKPENIFLDAKLNAKIGDFGFSREWRSGEFLTDRCGSLLYAAPELISEDCRYEGPGVDVWALGVILYALLCNSMPFDAPNDLQISGRIMGGTYSMPAFLSKEARSLIGRMLVVDPSERASIPEIREHPWFQKDLPEALVEKNPSAAAATAAYVERVPSAASVLISASCQSLETLPLRRLSISTASLSTTASSQS